MRRPLTVKRRAIPNPQHQDPAVVVPPRCPSPTCIAHTAPESVEGGFFIRYGNYRPRCQPRPVPRFKCRVCCKGFSRQTFRPDYRDHKPHLNPRLAKLLAAGVGLRESGRRLELSWRCLQLKARKISGHLGGIQAS